MKRLIPIFFAVVGTGYAAMAQDQSAADATTDQEFAARLWQQLAQLKLVGEDATRTRPYEGTEPHGVILEYLEQTVAVSGSNGLAIVKRNYGGEDLTIEDVWANPRESLMAVTVMYRREEGYDPENQNWFWAKYAPDGTAEEAGKVDGCISCHSEASGGDYIYSYDSAD